MRNVFLPQQQQTFYNVRALCSNCIWGGELRCRIDWDPIIPHMQMSLKSQPNQKTMPEASVGGERIGPSTQPVADGVATTAIRRARKCQYSYAFVCVWHSFWKFWNYKHGPYSDFTSMHLVLQYTQRERETDRKREALILVSGNNFWKQRFTFMPDSTKKTNSYHQIQQLPIGSLEVFVHRDWSHSC